MRQRIWGIIGCCASLLMATQVALAQSTQLPPLQITMGTTPQAGDLAIPLQILLLLTLLSFIPALLIAMTSFTRIVIVLSLLRQALGVQQVPPNQVLIGLALLLTIFIMRPVGERLHTQVVQPYLAQSLTTPAALQQAVEPLRDFMLRQTREKDLALFIQIAHASRPSTPADVPLHGSAPSLCHQRVAYSLSDWFLLYLPFLILDLVISSLLVSMGMMMLPQTLISFPLN